MTRRFAHEAATLATAGARLAAARASRTATAGAPAAIATVAIAPAAGAGVRHRLDEVIEVALLLGLRGSVLPLGGLHHAHAVHVGDLVARRGQRFREARQAVAGDAERGGPLVAGPLLSGLEARRLAQNRS